MNTEDLKFRQKLTIDEKVLVTRERIREFVRWCWKNSKNPAVSFSGGWDSTVLWNIAKYDFPNMTAVFSNTGLEFPEIVSFVREHENVIEVRPKKPFHKVIKEYGWPIPSKMNAKKIRVIRDSDNPRNKNMRNLYLTGYNRNGQYSARWKLPNKWMKLVDAPFMVSDRCCDILKKEPIKRVQKQHNTAPIIGTMASDSLNRRHDYLRNGCNIFAGNDPKSRPMSFWSKDDVGRFIDAHGIKYCPVYDMGYERTGCIYCGFGVHLEKEPNRFQMLRRTHPNLHEYIIHKLGMANVLDYIGVKWF